MSYIGNSPGLATRQLFRFVATAGQTTFNGLDVNSLTLNYTPGLLDVYVDGLLIPASDYTASTGSSVVFSSGISAGSDVIINAYGSFSPADTLSKSQNGADILNKATFRNNIGQDHVVIADRTLTTAASDFSPVALAGYQEFEIDLTLYVNPSAANDVGTLFRVAFDGVPTFLIGSSDYIVAYAEMVGSGNKVGGNLGNSSLFMCSNMGKGSPVNTMKVRATFNKGTSIGISGRRATLLSRSYGFSTNYVLAEYGGYTSNTGSVTHFLIQASTPNGFDVGSRMIVKGRT